MDAEFLAKLFHETYEKLAPDFGYRTRKASAKPWFDVPSNNRNLMTAVAEKILSVQKRQAEDDCIEAETIEEVVDILIRLKGWRLKAVRWLWPQIDSIRKTLKDYCWKDCN